MDLPQAGSEISPQYTVFVRLPFSRNGFEDPEPVQWDTTKDKALWKLISKASNSKDINWEAMSLDLGVTLPFLLQQAAWLYERHFEGMKMQMKKLGAAGSVSGSASPRTTPAIDQTATASMIGPSTSSMMRTGSRRPPFAVPRTKPRLIFRTDATTRSFAINTARAGPLLSSEAGSTSTTLRSAHPIISRTPSTNTVTQSRTYQQAAKSPLQRTFRGTSGSQKMPTTSTPGMDSSHDDDDDSANSQEFQSVPHVESESGASSRRPPPRRPQIGKNSFRGMMSSDEDGDEEEEGSGGFLPFASTYKSARDDPAATLRSSPKKPPAQLSSAGKRAPQPPQPSESSASSSIDRRDSGDLGRGIPERPGALSPRHRAQLEQLSPRYRKSGSEGSPSMGSSFSDLDDASVTQSALEDALLSNMQHGSIGLGIGSRMSSLREGLGRK